MIDISTISKINAGGLAFEKFWAVKRAVNLAGTHELKPFGIGIRQAGFMIMLNRLGVGSQAELARRTGSDPAATGRAIAAMKKRGWIEQHDHPSDRRRWEIALTASGKGLARKVEMIFKHLEQQFSDSLSDKETASFIDTLDKILLSFTETR